MSKYIKTNFLIILLALLLCQGNTLALSNNIQVASTIKSSTIKIGVILPLTGDVDVYGSAVKKGIDMAVNEINSKGGVLGQEIELILRDDESEPEKSAELFKEISKKNKLAAVIGGVTTTCAKMLAEQAQQNKIVMLTPTPTKESVVKTGDYIFRTALGDSYQGKMIAKYIAKNLKLKKVAILYDPDSEYSNIVKEGFETGTKEMGIKVVAEAKYTDGCSDFSKQLIQIIGSKPDILFVSGFYYDVPLIAKQLKAKKSNIQLIGPDGFDSQAIITGPEVSGVSYITHFSAEANSLPIKLFVADYYRIYKEKPGAFQALGYDSLNLLVDAIKRAGSSEPDKIKTELSKTNKTYTTGKITFDKYRNTIKSIFVYKIKKNKENKLFQAFVTIVDP